jgi:hypothetical protein
MKPLFNKFNDYLADKLSYGLSTMIAFYFIVILVLTPLIYTQPSGFVAWASYLCSVIFQGIALPVLGYTARKAGDKSDALMKQIFEMAQKIESLVELLEVKQEHIDQELDLVEEEIEKK